MAGEAADETNSTCGSNSAGPSRSRRRAAIAERVGDSLDKLAGDPVDVYAGGRLVARGEAIVLDGKHWRSRGGTCRS